MEDTGLDGKSWDAEAQPTLYGLYVEAALKTPSSAAPLYIWQAKASKQTPEKIDALDELSSMTSSEDIAGVIKVHGQLLRLVSEIEIQGLTWEWKRMAETEPNAGEKCRQACPFFQ
ncbi:hypothetical protein BBP40_006355 [Aspergillus hancockii]|nr:hypothetical protein BBP40_006355 [Aspergillus hancockii]